MLRALQPFSTGLLENIWRSPNLCLLKEAEECSCRYIIDQDAISMSHGLRADDLYGLYTWPDRRRLIAGCI